MRSAYGLSANHHSARWAVVGSKWSPSSRPCARGWSVIDASAPVPGRWIRFVGSPRAGWALPPD